MKSISLLIVGVLCLGLGGCGGDDLPSTVAPQFDNGVTAGSSSDLFSAVSETERMQTEKTMQIIEAINHKYQCNAVYLAAAGGTKQWRMKKERCTPSYTTKWTELPLVYAQ